MGLKDFSTDFPFIKETNYLTTASIGLVPKPVIAKTRDFFVEMARGGTIALDEEKEVQVYDDLRNVGSKLLGCAMEDIVVFNSVSEALNVVAWSLELKEGKIISTNIEFPSVAYPSLRIAEKEERINTVLVDAVDWYVPIENIIKEIDETTRVVFISHVEYLTGQMYDLEEITRRAHEVGALVVVDGIQAAGYTPVDVNKLQVDVYITGSYKWLCAPFGTAIAYISKDLCDSLTPVFVGWRSTENMWNFNPTEIKYASTARKFEYSTSAYGVKLGMAESISYLQQIGIENINAHDMKLIEILRDELEQIEGIEIITPDDNGSILTFKIKGRNSHEIGKRLQKLERPIELSIRQNMIRISPHFYNNETDILHTVNSIKKIV
ncbi:MAG: aminotransferase class V-fold PLP-dependent enzyme [Candidatus Hodarchaeales archaeon]|jgi:selenocysteine lyase/cysteine desulfurase